MRNHYLIYLFYYKAVKKARQVVTSRRSSKRKIISINSLRQQQMGNRLYLIFDHINFEIGVMEVKRLMESMENTRC